MDSKKDEPFRAPEASRRPYVEESSGRYRLRTQHVLGDRLLEAGTEVGTDTDYPWPGEPTNQMEGLDDASVGKVNALFQKLYGTDAPWHDPKLAHAPIAQERAKQAEQQKQEAESAAPVSHQQAWEQGKEWDKTPHPMVAARTGAPPAPVSNTKGGDLSGGPSTATPLMNAPERTPVEPRPSKPNEEQLPKDK